MNTRLQDLISTADKQMASRAYEAAVDNYRTALGEPGAVEAGVEGLLEAACVARDAASGIARPAERPAPPEPPKVEAIPPPPVEPPADPRVEPAPPPVCESPIEPPGFYLIEDDPSILERSDRQEYVEPKPIGILDPTPLPEEPDSMGIASIGIAALIISIACAVLFYASFGRSITPRSSLTSGAASPVLLFKTDPEYTAAARQARIQGAVMLDVEIQLDGTATVQRLTKGLDPGLDQRAIEAVSKWRFRPGMKNGRPVKTLAHVAVNFRLL